MIEFKLLSSCTSKPISPTTAIGISSQPVSGFAPDIHTATSSEYRDRLIGAMPVAFDKLRPETMLKPACLFCGRLLTDPVSMARWIGPECAGTAAAITPFAVNLAA